MKSYYDLLKNNIIQFDKSLLEKYFELGLDETECIVLLRLHQSLEANKSDLNLKRILKKLSISKDTLSEVIINLVNKGFITLTKEDDNALETFSLDGAYKQLGFVFEGNEQNDKNNKTSIEMKKTLDLLQERLGKILSPLEINIVKKWFYDYKYPIDVINKQIDLVCSKRSKSVNLIDRALYSLVKEDETDDANKAIELFDKLYGK